MPIDSFPTSVSVALSILPVAWHMSHPATADDTGSIVVDKARGGGDLRVLQDIFQGFDKIHEITDSALQCLGSSLLNAEEGHAVASGPGDWMQAWL